MMGKDRLVDKTIKPLTTTLTNLTPALVTAGTPYTKLGNLPIGYYKGSAAFWDLNLAVNEPNVQAEKKHILGILDGREEDYDLQTLGITAGEAIGTLHSATLTVPVGEVWFINVVRGVVPATVTSTVLFNWWCNSWTDRIASAAAGQPFYTAAQTGVAGGGIYTYDTEFSAQAAVWNVLFKDVSLRLPAGTILTCVFTTATAVGEAINCTFQLFGYIGKTLVV